MKLAKIYPWLLAGLALFGWQTAAQASSISTTLSVSGTFDNIVASAGTEYRTHTNEFPGRTALDWGNCEACNGRSSRITFDGFSTPGQGNNGFSSLEEPFVLGKLQFHNGTGRGDTGILSGSLNVSVLLDGYAKSPFDFVFDLGLSEVPPADETRKHGRDTLTLSSQWSSFDFTTELGSYRLNILGWSQDGGMTFVDTLTIDDPGTGALKLYASLTPTAVPVPAALWLFGSGLLGLVGIARRR